MNKILFVMMLMLVASTSLIFAQEATQENEFVEAESFQISEEISEPVAFNSGSGGSGSVFYPEIIPGDGMPQSDIVGKPVSYATDYYTQYQQNNNTTTILLTSIGICVLACAVYYLLYAVSY